MKPIEEKYIGNIKTKPEPYCPECGEKCILKLPRPDQTWEPFWGCSDFPKCRGSVNIGEDGLPVILVDIREDYDADYFDDWRAPGYRLW